MLNKLLVDRIVVMISWHGESDDRWNPVKLYLFNETSPHSLIKYTHAVKIPLIGFDYSKLTDLQLVDLFQLVCRQYNVCR